MKAQRIKKLMGITMRGSLFPLRLPSLSRVCYNFLINISISLDGDLDYGPEPEWLTNIATKILTLAEAPENSVLGFMLAGENTMQATNLEFLLEDRPTDVLAFALRETKSGETPSFVYPPDGLTHLGEVVVCFPVAEQQAKEHGHSVNREVAILTIHGVLHLLGYDHTTAAKAKKMQAKEAEILEAIKSETK